MSPFPDLPGLVGALAWRAEVQPDRMALGVDGEAGITYARWWERVVGTGCRLARSGVRPGDRVALVFGHRDQVDLAVAQLAVHLAGAVAVPLSERSAPARLDHAIGHAGCRVALTARSDRPVPWTVPVAHLGLDALDGSDHPVDDWSPPASAGGDLAQILFTSGTSGRPKGVGASHDNLADGFRPDLRRLPLRHAEVAVHAFAVGTNAAQTMLVNAVTAHPTVLTPSRPSAARLARLIERSRAGAVFLVPSTAIELLRSGALTGRDLSAVNLVGSTAAHLPPAVAADLAATFPRAVIANTYTSTEAAPAGATVIYDPARPESLGRPEPGTLRICSPDGAVLGPGEVGEVWIRSPRSRSYIGDRAATAATFRRGWVRMGDLGRLGPDGHLHLVDRESDLVKTGAHKVSTLEVEAALHDHPDVAAAAVVGLPDPVLGSVLAAAVIPRSGTAPTLADLRSFLATRLDDHELPVGLRLVDDLPRNDGGKVVKRDLVAWFTSAATPPPTAAADPADPAQGSGEKGHPPMTLPGSAPPPPPFDPVPLGDGQHGLLMAERLSGSRHPNHLTTGLWLEGPLDPGALAAAWSAVSAAHPALRAAVVDGPDGPVLVPAIGEPDVTVEPLAIGQLSHHVAAPFPLERGPLARCRILVRSPRRALVLVVVNHLVADGTSRDIIVDDLATAYRAISGGRTPDLGLRELVVAAPARPGAVAAASGHWQRQHPLSGELSLPGLVAGAAGVAGEGRGWLIEVPATVDHAIRSAALAWDNTVYEVVLAGVLALIRRYGSADPVVTLPLSVRTSGRDDVVGHLVNELPFRAPATDVGFRAYVAAVADALRPLYRVRSVPLARAVPGRRPTGAWSPLVVGYRRTRPLPDFSPLVVEVDRIVHSGSARAALELQVVDAGAPAYGGGGLSVAATAATAAFPDGGAERVGPDLLDLLAAAIARPDIPLPALDTGAAVTGLPTPAQASGPAPGPVSSPIAVAGGHPPAGTVLAMVADQARRRPGATALVEGDRSLTYGQLARAVLATADRLRDRGAGPGERVVVAVGHRLETVVVLLACMAARAAYVPVDPAHPEARRHLIVDDAAARLTVDDVGGGDRTALADLVTLDGAAAGPADLDRLTVASRPGDVAYLMYTSGSTGVPKGVAVHHGAVANLVTSLVDRLSLGPDHRWLALTTLSFDISGLELYGPLASGGVVVLPGGVRAGDGRAVVDLVRSRGVTHVQATPSGWWVLLEAGFGERAPEPVVALAGGEALPPPLARDLAVRVDRLHNVYGPTETTIWSTIDDVSPGDEPVTIGRPIANTRIHIVDERLRPVPDGSPGELAIAGDGVAVGYHRRPGRTAARFVPEPGGDGTRMYLTGDQVRRLDDGRLEFLGRGDDQVKVRGHRVELGEIEARLLTHLSVAEGAVSVVGEGPEQQLVAWVVWRGDPVAPAAMREHLAAALPTAMVPTAWRSLDRLPRTPNGKLDRRALAGATPEPTPGPVAVPGPEAVPDPVAAPGPVPVDDPAPDPVGEVVAAMVAIWSDVLQIDDLGPDDDLFDLGGHSLTITRINARVLQRFGVDVPLDAYFDTPTPGEIARLVVGAEVTA